jgi:hypothetical protein
MIRRIQRHNGKAGQPAGQIWFMRKIVLFLSLTVFVFEIFGQNQPIKFAEVGDEKSLTPDFVRALDRFAKEILRGPASLQGFIAISGSDLATLSERHKIVETKIRKNLELQRRVEISRRGTRYLASWEKSEFWLIPSGSTRPYIALSGHVDCPTVGVQGKVTVANKNETLAFTTKADADFTRYKWSVDGGRVISGQGTPAILVRIDRSMRVGEGMGVTATVKINGLPDGSLCSDTASFTTILAPLPNID